MKTTGDFAFDPAEAVRLAQAWLRAKSKSIQELREEASHMPASFASAAAAIQKRGDEMMSLCFGKLIQDGAIRNPVAVAPDVVTQTAEVIHGMVRWALAGLPVFRISESLAAMLALTDCDDIPGIELHIPFPAFCVEIEGTPFSTFDELLGVDRPLNRLWLTSRLGTPQDEQDGGSASIVTAAALEVAAAQTMRTRWTISILDSTSADPVRLWAFRPEAARCATLGEWRAAGGTSQLSERDDAETRAMLRFFANLCLFIATTKPAHEPVARAARRRAERSGMLDIPTTWQLGQEIELGPELKQAAREYCGGQRRRAAWKLSARFVVRGHWRNQACGPKLVERRRQWIQPYWKGAEGGGISHMYTDATAR